MTNRVFHALVVAVMVVTLVYPSLSSGENVSPESGAHHMMTDPNKDPQALLDQITELQAEVAKLRAAVQQTDPMKRSRAGSRMKSGGKAMVVMDDMGEMGGMGTGQNRGMSQGSGGGMGMMDDQGEMGGMSPGAGGAMGMMDEGEMGGMSSGGDMGMCCMGEMGGMTEGMRHSGKGSMRSSSTMPGQPGASHLYHIGSTGFFLNHSKHITLTPEQKMTLNRLKEKALLDRTTAQRRMGQAEQDLYILTGADQPDPAKIQAKVGEIEKLRTDQRMTFIRAVSEAVNVLTHDQHQALLGTMTPNQK
jgi:Spy/CpxP family protein refolding chaperone